MIRGEAVGVKRDGGVLDVVVREVEVECLPADIPERFECDVSELQLNESIRVRDLPPLERVEILEDGDRVVLHVVSMRVEEVAESEDDAVAGAPEGAASPGADDKGKKEDGA